MLDHAEQVAALEAVGSGRAVPRFKIAWLGQGFAFGETVGKYLVENGVSYPLRGLRSLVSSSISIVAHRKLISSLLLSFSYNFTFNRARIISTRVMIAATL